jgi:ribosomal protein S18 acetylase RimI-like enzyme
VEERLREGESASGYSFVFAEDDKGLLGYSCYGRVWLTEFSYDLYWIAVRPDSRGTGLSGKILSCTEEKIRARGGTQLFAETSGTDKYAPARGFYLRNGFVLATTFADFYRPGDDKLVFRKNLA